jgi:lysozyme
MSLREMLERHEGRKNRVYKCTAGKDTIGVGHNIDAKGLPPDIESFLEDNGYITDEMIDRLLDDDIEDAISDCKRLYPNLEDFGDVRMNALIDFVFNVGYGTARKFVNTNKLINAEKWEQASDSLLQSKYARQVKGRAKEIAEMLRWG